MTDQPQQQVQQVTPSPVPATWTVQTVPTPGGQIIALIIASPTGQAVYFLDPDEALVVANQIRTTARQAKSGLILPPTLNGKGGIL